MQEFDRCRNSIDAGTEQMAILWCSFVENDLGWAIDFARDVSDPCDILAVKAIPCMYTFHRRI